MNTPHLTAGSVQPAYVSNKLRVYATKFSSDAQRIFLTLQHKGIEFDPVFINLNNQPEWFVEKSPFGIVPVIELTNGQTIYGSKVIGDYLEETYPEKKLYPTDSFSKAQVKTIVEKIISTDFEIYELYKKADPALFEKVVKFFDVLNAEYKKRGKPFFGGDRPEIVDYFFWPIFERFEVLRIIRGDKYVFSSERFTYLFQWGNIMKKEQSVKALYLDPEVHAKYIKSEIAGRPDFDFLYN